MMCIDVLFEDVSI